MQVLTLFESSAGRNGRELRVLRHDLRFTQFFENVQHSIQVYCNSFTHV